MSLSEIIVNQPLRLSVVSAIASSSYFFFCALGPANLGIIPAIQDPFIINKIPLATKAELWKWLYDRAKVGFVASTSISAISFATSAYLASSPGLTKLFSVASVCSFAVPLFTGVKMLPVNNQLAEIHSSGILVGKEVTSTEAKGFAEKIEAWKRMHRLRLFLGASAWVAGMAALAFDF